MTTDNVNPRRPRKPVRRHKEGDNWIPDEMMFHEEVKYRKKWIPNGYRWEYGEKVPKFRKMTDEALKASNRDAAGNSISNSPANFWAMLGYITNKRPHSYDEIMHDRDAFATPLWDRLDSSVSLSFLARRYRSAATLLDLYGDLMIRRSDLHHIRRLGKGLVAIYEGRSFHGPRKGSIKGRHKWYDLDRWTKALDEYNGGELHMDRGALSNHGMKMRLEKDMIDYLDGDDSLNAEAIAKEYTWLKSCGVREVRYIDTMGFDIPRSSKPHAE